MAAAQICSVEPEGLPRVAGALLDAFALLRHADETCTCGKESFRGGRVRDATRSSVACVPRFATVQFDGRAEETTILEVVVFRVAVDSDD